MIIEANDWYMIAEIPDCSQEHARKMGIKWRVMTICHRIAVWEKNEDSVIGYISWHGDLETIDSALASFRKSEEKHVRLVHSSHFTDKERQAAEQGRFYTEY